MNYRWQEVLRPVLKKVMVKGTAIYEYLNEEENWFMTTIGYGDIADYLSKQLSIPKQRLKVIMNDGVQEDFKVPSYLI